MLFKNYISSNYSRIKLLIKRNCWKYAMVFDEDVFQDTMMRCLETLREEKTPKEFDGYVLGAYNKNLWREASYARNKYLTNLCEEDKDVPENNPPDHKIDLELLYEHATNKYGYELVSLFKQWLKGYSVRELQEQTGIQDLTYQFKKIREFLTTIK